MRWRRVVYGGHRRRHARRPSTDSGPRIASLDKRGIRKRTSRRWRRRSHSLGWPRRFFFCYKAPMPHPLLVLLFDFLQLLNCLILIFAMHITRCPTQRAPPHDIVPSHLTSPANRLVDSGILPWRLQGTPGAAGAHTAPLLVAAVLRHPVVKSPGGVSSWFDKCSEVPQ